MKIKNLKFYNGNKQATKIFRSSIDKTRIVKHPGKLYAEYLVKVDTEIWKMFKPSANE